MFSYINANRLKVVFYPLFVKVSKNAKLSNVLSVIVKLIRRFIELDFWLNFLGTYL